MSACNLIVKLLQHCLLQQLLQQLIVKSKSFKNIPNDHMISQLGIAYSYSNKKHVINRTEIKINY